MKRYAAYKADRLIGKGSIREMGELLGVGVSTAWRYATTEHHNKVKGTSGAKYIVNLNAGPVLYEAFRGYELLAAGTREEVAAALNVKAETVRFMTTPSHFKRMVNIEEFLHVIRVDEEEEGTA